MHFGLIVVVSITLTKFKPFLFLIVLKFPIKNKSFVLMKIILMKLFLYKELISVPDGEIFFSFIGDVVGGRHKYGTDIMPS